MKHKKGENMGCTINYSGSLKQEYTPEHVFEVIEKHAGNIPCKLHKGDLKLTVIFDSGVSEDLVFDFSQGRLNDFCKWNTQNPKEGIYELEKVFNMFIEMQPMFKSLHVEDDWGAFSEYSVMNKPCKIILRKLISKAELGLIDRLKKFETTPPSKVVEKVMKSARLSNTEHIFLLRLIAEDYVTIMGYTDAKQFSWKSFRDVQNTLCAFFAGCRYRNPEYEFKRLFQFECPYFIMIVWLSSAFEYKKYGLVEVAVKLFPKGVFRNTEAALYGILSNFLNFHSETVNTKHAEMNKFIKKQCGTDSFYLVNFDSCKVLEIFVSMMDYLGFKYVGPSAFNDKDVI